MRDAVFGNVGTMIIFRVGSDDAEFLEKEFEPEFTQEDIVNLPNYKIYLKLMIDGVTSRPFSAKTLPQMVKSGNKEIEDEVIRMSRALYCKPREDVEREINEWSGMTIGEAGEIELESSKMEKFPAICSMCKKETTVPFKPEPGRSVYCKECIAKIKAGELKPLKNSVSLNGKLEDKTQESMRDQEIKQQLKDSQTEKKHGVTTENITRVFYAPSHPKRKTLLSVETRLNEKSNGVNNRPKFFEDTPRENKFKDKSENKPRENLALKEFLSKTLQDNDFFENKREQKQIEPIREGEGETQEEFKEIKIIHQKTISLDSLKQKTGLVNDMEDIKPEISSIKKDRAASAEDMNKLKDLIATKSGIETTQSLEDKDTSVPIDKRIKESPSMREWRQKIKEKGTKEDKLDSSSKNREIPEDVLMKILE
jgi:CxxC-x17-CxxC domain-containing protein